MKKSDFLHVDANSLKLKVDWKNWVDLVINGCAHSGHRTLKLAASLKEINGIKVT